MFILNGKAESCYEVAMYIVVKIIKGRRYLYEQRSWREGKRVRTASRYLGPAGGGGTPQSAPRKKGLLRKVGDLIEANRLTPEQRALVVDEKAMLKAVKARETAERVSRQAGLDKLHDLYGLRMPSAAGSRASAPEPARAEASVAKENPSAYLEGKGAPAADTARPE